MADGNQVLIRPAFDLTTDTSLEEPDMSEVRDERFNRNRTTMRMIDHHVSDQILPQTRSLGAEERAATRIQAVYRGYQGRKKYVELLYSQYEQEYDLQRQKTLMQMEEGDLLVQNHRLEVECEDNRTTRKNKMRQYEANVITIQRAWRRHLEKGLQQHVESDSPSEVPAISADTESISGAQPMSISTSIDSLRNARSDEDLLSDLSLSVKSDYCGSKEMLAIPHSLTNRNILIDADLESSVSDYSEMADCIKEHLANVQIIQKEDLDFENTLQNEAIVQQKILRLPGETDPDYAKRLRKLNILSLAQEFAALKKVDSAVLPFGAHKAGQLPSPMSEGTPSEASDASSAAVTPSEGTKDFVSVGNPTGVREAWHDNKPAMQPSMQPSAQSSHAGNPKQSQHSGDNPGVHPEDQPDSESKLIRAPTAAVADRTGPVSSFEKQHEALSPFRHRSLLKGGAVKELKDKESSGAAGKGEDFDVYNMECTLPVMDWDKLEKELLKAAEEEKNKKARKNDREEILRKLAMAPEEDGAMFSGDRPLKKSASQMRYHQTGQNLQLCFMNETMGEKAAATAATPHKVTTEAPVQVTVTDTQPEAPEENLDLPSRKQKLQHEATIALAQVRPMAKMQLQVEKQVKKKSPIAEITGIPELGDGKILQLSLAMLQDMNVAQLQVILNDLHSQIEGLNMELVSLLIERDDLHMEQDSMLVDIEDLHRRAEELSERAASIPNPIRHKDRTK